MRYYLHRLHNFLSHIDSDSTVYDWPIVDGDWIHQRDLVLVVAATSDLVHLSEAGEEDAVAY